MWGGEEITEAIGNPLHDPNPTNWESGEDWGSGKGVQQRKAKFIKKRISAAGRAFCF